MDLKGEYLLRLLGEAPRLVLPESRTSRYSQRRQPRSKHPKYASNRCKRVATGEFAWNAYKEKPIPQQRKEKQHRSESISCGNCSCAEASALITNVTYYSLLALLTVCQTVLVCALCLLSLSLTSLYQSTVARKMSAPNPTSEGSSPGAPTPVTSPPPAQNEGNSSAQTSSKDATQPDQQATAKTSQSGDAASWAAPIHFGQYVVPMPLPGQPGALYFNGHNVSDFLERFEEQCQEHRVEKADRFRKLPRYCEKLIGNFVKTLPAWTSQDWDSLVVLMKKEYERDDMDQKIYSLHFLEVFKSKPRTEDDDLRVYSRQFRSIAIKLANLGQLDEYTCCRWYLQGLPPTTRHKVVKKHAVDVSKPKTMNFAALYDTVILMQESSITMQKLEPSRQTSEDLSTLADMCQTHRTTAKPLDKGTAFAPPVVNDPFLSMRGAESAVDSLTKAMEGLKLNALRGISREEVLQLIRQENQGRQAPLVPAASVSGFAPASTHVHVGAAEGIVSAPNMVSSPGCWECGEANHIRSNCHYTLDWVARGLIHRNEAGRWCYGRAGSGGAEMALTKGMTRKEAIERCLQRQNLGQGTVQVQALRLDDDSSSEEEGLNEEDILVEVRSARQEHDPKVRSAPWRPAIEQSARILRNKSKREESLPKVKNFRPGNYQNSSTQEEKGSANPDLLGDDVFMTEADSLNPNTRAAKLQKLKKVKEELNKEKEEAGGQDKAKKMARFLKDKADAKTITRQMLESTIEVKIMDLLGLCPDINRNFFRSMTDTEFEEISSPKDHGESREVKINSMGISTTESVHLNDAVVRVASLRKQALFAVACPTVYVHIGDVKVRALLDSGAEINCITRRLAYEAMLPVRKGTAISLVAATGDKACFIGVCDDVEVSLGGAVVTTPIFVVDQSDHDLILGRPFARAARMQSTNMDDGSLEVSIHSDDGTKKVSFPAVPARHPRNKDASSIFQTSESLN